MNETKMIHSRPIPAPELPADVRGGSSLHRLVRRLAELGEQSAGEIGQELWLQEGAWRGIPENTIATRYCRPAGKLLREAERRKWVRNRWHRNRWLWRVTHEGMLAVQSVDCSPCSNVR